jgi:hypothetical protein
MFLVSFNILIFCRSLRENDDCYMKLEGSRIISHSLVNFYPEFGSFIANLETKKKKKIYIYIYIYIYILSSKRPCAAQIWKAYILGTEDTSFLGRGRNSKDRQYIFFLFLLEACDLAMQEVFHI